MLGQRLSQSLHAVLQVSSWPGLLHETDSMRTVGTLKAISCKRERTSVYYRARSIPLLDAS
jgi:hypothetical protein